MTDEDKIIYLLSNNPQMTRKELAKVINISPAAIKRRLDKLKKAGKIEHQGSTKAGKWVVYKQ